MYDEYEDAGFERTGIKKRMKRSQWKKIKAGRDLRKTPPDTAHYTRQKGLGIRDTSIVRHVHGLVLSIKVNHVPFKTIEYEGIEHFGNSSTISIFTYARHHHTNYEELNTLLNNRGILMQRYRIVLQIAIAERIKEMWPALSRAADIYSESETKKFIANGMLDKTEHIRMNDDGSLHWRIWEEQAY